MAKTYPDKREVDLPGDKYQWKKDYQSDLDMHDRFIAEWDANEAMLLSKTYDSVSKKTQNGITDGEAATMVIERSARVVGQLPDGVIEAAGKKDRGKAIFMDILRQKWIYPNANAQRPFLDKIRLWEQYSGVYGEMPMFYDWDVTADYVGPNCWLWNPRNFIPQQGRYTIDDMDYAHAISYMSEKDIEDEIEKYDEDSGWDLTNLKTLLEVVRNSSVSMDNQRNTFVERQRTNQEIRDRIMLVTRFEAGDDGHWISFAPDFACLQLRDIENPHGNGKIPFVIKPGIPLFDSFYNLAEMSRAKPLQFAKDGLTNFYFQGIKMNIYPPTVVNAQGILKHTVSNEPGAVWEEIIPNSARRLETSTAGLATYQAAMGQMSGAMQNIFGTTSTQLNAETSMSAQFGKTPEALKYQQGRESARDNQNRAYLQTSIETLMDRFMELIVNMGTEEIPIDLFSEDIIAIKKAGYDDVMQLIVPNESRRTGRLIIDPKKLKGVTYRFNMKPDSTVRVDKAEKKQNLIDLMEVLKGHQNELDNIQKTTGKHINWEQLFETYAELADLPGLDELFVQGPIPHENSPMMQLLERMNVKFETLPESAQQWFLQQWGAPAQGDPTTTQQTVAIKAQEAHTKQQIADTKLAEAHTKHLTATSNILAQHEQQPPAAPEAINGMIFHDSNVNAAAKGLEQMRGKPNAS
jgi:hypothetical protein